MSTDLIGSLTKPITRILHYISNTITNPTTEDYDEVESKPKPYPNLRAEIEQPWIKYPSH